MQYSTEYMYVYRELWLYACILHRCVCCKYKRSRSREERSLIVHNMLKKTKYDFEQETNKRREQTHLYGEGNCCPSYPGADIYKHERVKKDENQHQ